MNLWSKEVPVNISYPIIVNPIDAYLDARIIPSYVIYTIRKDKPNQYKTKTINISQGGDFHWLYEKYILIKN